MSNFDLLYSEKKVIIKKKKKNTSPILTDQLKR